MNVLQPGWRRTQFLRRVVAAALVLLAGALWLHGEDTVPVMVATRDLPAGHVLTAGDTRLAKVPPKWVPSQTTLEVEGATVVSAVARGEVLTLPRMVHEGTAADLLDNEDATLVPITLLNKEVIPLLRYGDTVAVLSSAEDGSAVVIAQGARVVVAQEGASILVALPHREAAAVAAAGLNTPLAITIRR